MNKYEIIKNIMDDYNLTENEKVYYIEMMVKIYFTE